MAKTNRRILTADEAQRAHEIVGEVLQLPVDRRRSLLEREVNPLVRAEVDSLLQAESAASSARTLAPLSTLERALNADDESEPEFRRLPPGYSVGGFRIIRLLGEGAFASVYLAFDEALGREVALKISASTMRSAEAKTLAHLEHDHIVKVFSEALESGQDMRLLCMQYVPGTTLERVIDNVAKAAAEQASSGKTVLDIIDTFTGTVGVFHPAALRFREMMQQFDFVDLVLWTGMRLGDALAHAHSQGILHLDVKPGNVLMSVYGRPLLTDFNVSLDLRRFSPEKVNEIGGTLQYMPPEQRLLFEVEPERRVEVAKQVDHRADLFALGITLREFFEAEKNPNADLAHFADVGDFLLVRSQLERALARCTAPDPKARYLSASEATAAFSSCLELRRALKRMPPATIMVRFARRFPLLAMTCAGVIPQISASLLGIAYNQARIVSFLTPEQSAAFDRLNWFFCPAMFALGAVYWFYELAPLTRYFNKERWKQFSPAAIEAVRARAVKLPIVGIVVSCLGWIPSAVLYPLYLGDQGSVLPPAVSFHFVVSFLLGASIAIAYTYLIHQYVLLRTIYPRLCVDISDLPKTAARELRPSVRWLHLAKLATAIPLIGALLLVPSASDTLPTDQFMTFRYVLVTLIIGGMIGAFFSASMRQRLERLYLNLTGKDTESLGKWR